MNAKMYRVEDKYCCTAQDMYQLQHRLDAVLWADSNENTINGYQVISLYFDDLADSCLNAVREGSYSRLKYRIRIYNNSFDRISLEVKEKQGSRIYKKARSITEKEMHQLIQGECISASFSLEDPAFMFNLAIQTKALRPKVIVAYERKAYIYPSGNVRITFDRNIRASSQIAAFGSKKISYDPLREQDAVLEIKYDEFLPEFILQLLEQNSMQQTACSKYRLCRERYQQSF
ncbi:MAG: polyphosphate polymerase domain-containing protein [Lachnospiraceae bacterium]|jgi:hypothetical protein|nr:hypothetical protein C819_02436 [Lachnospiraceae bacterium 10-1]MCX4352525.1 polyphosphate polymerase domain-containing protein [Lachnospiraceae bacterium]